MHTRFFYFLAAAVLLLAGSIGVLYSHNGWYGINVIARRGGTFWRTVDTQDAALPASMQLALQPAVAQAEAGAMAWKIIAKGFEVSELPVIAQGKEVDRFLLARIDPHYFRFEVHNASAGDRELDDWMKVLGAAFVINGSYYADDGLPDTPFLSNGVLSGPKEYDAQHGAFIASAAFTGICDLQHKDWHDAFAGADNAMVSYPLLIAADGSNRVHADSHWLANRSFVGQDAQGNIILGTTQQAFFSLEQLAMFLKQAPLGLTMALNLDGGPVACQGVALNGFHRDFCGAWETKVVNGKVKLLEPGMGTRRWALPVVLAVVAKR